MTLAVGDHVTVVLGGKLHFCAWEEGGMVSRRVVNADEGVQWIRGWHNESTDEGKALLAAAAMTRALEIKEKFFEAYPELKPVMSK